MATSHRTPALVRSSNAGMKNAQACQRMIGSAITNAA